MTGKQPAGLVTIRYEAVVAACAFPHLFNTSRNKASTTFRPAKVGVVNLALSTDFLPRLEKTKLGAKAAAIGSSLLRRRSSLPTSHLHLLFSTNNGIHLRA